VVSDDSSDTLPDRSPACHVWAPDSTVNAVPSNGSFDGTPLQAFEVVSDDSSDTLPDRSPAVT